jgi:hypothetical protein
MSRRFQFSLKELLWLMLCIACFLGGMSVQRSRTGPIGSGMQSIGGVMTDGITTGDQTTIEYMTMPGGKKWFSMPSNGELRLYSDFSKDGEHEKYMKMPDGSRWRQIEEGECKLGSP